jgi:putative ATPase
MKDLGYGQGYRYAHDYEGAYVPQDYLPDELAGRRFYEPGELGFEREVAKRLEWWRKRKQEG